MKLNNKGQITIPAPLRAKHGLRAGYEIDVVEGMTTDEIMELLRGA